MTLHAVDLLEPLTTTLKHAVLASVVYYVASALWSIFLSPLSAVPGPFLAKFSGVWLLRTSYMKARHVETEKAHQQYGPIVRLGPNLISVRDETAVKQIYNKSFDKSDFYIGGEFNGRQKNGFSTLITADHTPIRKLSGQPYTPKNILGFETELRELGTQLIHRIERDGQNGDKAVDTITYARFFALDSLSIVSFGQPFDILKEKDDHVICHLIDGLNLCVGIRSILPPWLDAIVERLPIPPVQRILACDPAFCDFVYSLFNPVKAELQRVKAEDLPRQTVTTIFLSQPLATTGAPMKDGQIISELISHVFAGADTSSMVTTYTLYTLAHRPDLQDELFREVSKDNPDRHVIPALNSLATPLLAATVKEGLRIFAAAPAHLERIVPASGVNLLGFDVPAGTRVASQIYSMHRLESAFPDGDVFRPQRWLEATDQMNRLWAPFGYANRTCPGQNLAVMNLRIVLFAILRNFKVELHPDTTPACMAIEETFLISPKGHKCLLYFKPRET